MTPHKFLYSVWGIKHSTHACWITMWPSELCFLPSKSQALGGDWGASLVLYQSADFNLLDPAEEWGGLPLS